MLKAHRKKRSPADSFCSHFNFTAFLLFSLIVSANTSAAFIFWSNHNGTADFFEWQNGGSDKGLFGNPSLIIGEPALIGGEPNIANLEIGNTFHFSPANFIAQSINGRSSIKSDRLQIDIIACPNEVILGVKITEHGIYDIEGTGKVSASAGVFITNLDQYEVRSAMLQMDQTMPISTPPNNDANWSGEVIITGLSWKHLRIVLNNNLIATSQVGSDSFIQKTSLDIQIIPEPATIAILALGGLGLRLYDKKTKSLNRLRV